MNYKGAVLRNEAFEQESHLSRGSFTRAFFIMALIGCLLALWPAVAYGTYSNPQISTVASVQTDGSMRVVEQRSFHFDESYAALTWPFSSLPADASIQINAVRMAPIDAEGSVIGEWTTLVEVPFQTAWRDYLDETDGVASKMAKLMDGSSRLQNGAGGESGDYLVGLPSDPSWAYDHRQNEFYAFFEGTVDPTVIECDFTIVDVALVYDDIAEIYWDYVPVQQDVDASNIHVDVQLPVPEGVTVVPSENVLAWGHGPRGHLEIKPDGTIELGVPEVLAGQYAQVHIVFPQGWLTNLPLALRGTYSGTRLDDAKAEETGWTDSWSSWQINQLSLDLWMMGLCVVIITIAILLYLFAGREQGDRLCAQRMNPVSGKSGALEACGVCAGMSEADRAAVEALDPAVLGRLERWDQLSDDDFATTIYSMGQRGIIQVVRLGDEPSQVRIRVSPQAKDDSLSPLQRETMRILFDVIGDGYQSISLEDIALWRQGHPQAYAQEMERWQAVLSEEVRQAHVFDERSFKLRRGLCIVAAVLVLLGIVVGFALKNIWYFALFAASGVIVGVIANYIVRRTPFGLCAGAMLESDHEER